MMNIDRIDSVRCGVGEAPVWEVAEQALFLLDIPANRIIRYRPVDDAVAEWATPAPATALALREDGGALLAIKDTLYGYDFATGRSTALAVATDQPGNATFNDGKVDRQGRFVIGSCTTDFADPQPIGGIFGYAGGDSVARLADNIALSNGTCFSPDGATLYFADCARMAIYAYDYDTGTGTVGDRRLFATTQELGGIPDGATVDADGIVWSAINQGGKIAAFRPDGTLERTVELPASHPGSVMFGGADLDALYVTTIDPTYFGQPADEHGGFLYRVSGLGARGLPEMRCRA